MKKLQRFIALALTVAILGVTLCSCSDVGKSIMDDTYSQYENVASSASFITQEGKTKGSFSLKGKEEEVDFGLVFQDFNLFPHFSVMKNIVDAPLKVQKRKKTI